MAQAVYVSHRPTGAQIGDELARVTPFPIRRCLVSRIIKLDEKPDSLF